MTIFRSNKGWKHPFVNQTNIKTLKYHEGKNYE